MSITRVIFTHNERLGNEVKIQKAKGVYVLNEQISDVHKMSLEIEFPPYRVYLNKDDYIQLNSTLAANIYIPIRKGEYTLKSLQDTFNKELFELGFADQTKNFSFYCLILQ